MSHLASCYSRSLGVKIGYPVLQPHFFPILEDKFVTIHTSNKCPSKNFSYWNDVVKILKPELEKRGIKVFQVGTRDDPQIEGVDLFFNNLSFKQSSYLLQKALCHVGIDSSPVHIASALNKPTVSLYAHAPKELCGPLWNKDKAILLESDRGGKKPSFSNYEDPKEIDRIKPEEIAESVFKLLNIREYNSQKTIFIGRKYLSKIIDIIPSKEPSNIDVNDATVRVRMDLTHNTNVLESILKHTQGQIEVILRQPIKRELVENFKSKISKITYTTNRFSSRFLKMLRGSGLAFELNCTDPEKLKEQRLKFFHYEIQLCKKEDEAKELYEKYKDISRELKIYTGRYYVEGQNVFSTIAKNQNDFKFWIDAKYFRVFEETSKTI